MLKVSNFFFRRKISRRLCSDGVKVDTEYLLFINDFDPRSFSNRDELRDYLQRFRNENEINKLQIYRVETFSL